MPLTNQNSPVMTEILSREVRYSHAIEKSVASVVWSKEDILVWQQ